MVFKKLAWVLAAAAAFSSPARAELLEKTVVIPRDDGSPIKIMISRLSGARKMPVLLAIDGSLCIPSRLNQWIRRLSPEKPGFAPYALVTVEKPEPSQPVVAADGSYSIGPDFQCTEMFKKYYSVYQRRQDHLRALQYLRLHADWWDGRLFLWGFSDGGRVAGQVANFAPERRRMVLVGYGRNASMAALLEDIQTGPKERTEDRKTKELWASLTDEMEIQILQGIAIPILVVHGTEDKSVPVTSARLLVKRLEASGVPLVYREIQGMGHDLGSNLPACKGEELQREFLAWLLGG
jgi:dienelactone hydrolase